MECGNLLVTKPKTAFWNDFDIAEEFGIEAVKETAERCFNEWKDNIEYLAKLIMVINHKLWFWNNRNEVYADQYVKLYSDLYYKYNETAIHYIEKNLSEKDLNYYFRTLD